MSAIFVEFQGRNNKVCEVKVILGFKKIKHPQIF